MARRPKKKDKPNEKYDSSEEEEVANEKQSLNHQDKVMKGLQQQMKEQKKLIKDLVTSMDFSSESIGKLHDEIKKLQLENKQLKKDVQKLQNNEARNDKRIETLEQHVMRSKQASNNNNMVITNMPKFGDETDIKNVIAKIAEQVNHTLSPDEITDAYQNNNKKYDTHPIIVKLKTNQLKLKCIEFRKANKKIDIGRLANGLTNGDKNVNFHHLIEREYAEILNMAKQIAKQKQYKFVWYANMTILVRKHETADILKIKSKDDLKQIK